MLLSQGRSKSYDKKDRNLYYYYIVSNNQFFKLRISE
jgi:hypothetical protein